MHGSRLSSTSARFTILPAVCVLAFLFGVGTRCEADPLRAGVAAVDITADTPPANVHDPLFAKTLIVDDGTTKAVIISLDTIGASGTLVSRIRERAQEARGRR